MIATLAVLVSLLSVVAARLNMQPDVLAALKPGNSMIPKEWTKFKIAGKATANPTGYFVVTTFTGSPKCDGSASGVSGIGMGACMASGATSVAYDWGKTASSYAMKMYSTPDCTGTATTYNMPLMPCTASGNTGYLYTLANSTTPWKSYDAGVVSEMFTNSDNCHQEGSGDIYSWAPLNACTATTDDCDGTQASFTYTKCSGNTVSQAEFTDTACAVAESTNSRTLGTCVETGTDACTGETNPYPFFTQVCQEV